MKNQNKIKIEIGKKIFVILFVIMLVGFVSAANWYVDNAATGGNTGTSWADAWQSFASINWGSVNPGDAIYISGGSTNKVYYETLDVQTSGTLGNRVTITKGMDPGHNGEVKFDGEYVRDDGISLYYDKDYITIRGFSFEKFIRTGGVYARGTEGIIVEGCYFNNTDGGSGAIQVSGWTNPDGYGDRSGANRNAIIRNNTIITPKGSYPAWTDGIHSHYNINITMDGNYIYIGNEDINPHCDCVQTAHDESDTIINNYCIHDNLKDYNSQGLFMTENHGTFKIYNNVVYAPNTFSNLVGFLNRGGGVGNIEAYNNIVVGGKNSIFHTDDTSPILKNNIFVSTHDAPFVIFDSPLDALADIDYNIIYGPNTTNLVSAGGSHTWSGWQALGYDTNGINQDPDLDYGSFFIPRSGSPAIDNGFDLSSIFTTDKNGIARPQGSGWDIGAFEYQGATQQPYNGPHNIPGRVEAEDYDTGGEGIGYHDTSTGNTGGQYRSEDVDIKFSNDSSEGGGYSIGWVEAGEWLEYTIDVSSNANYTFDFRVLSQMTTGQFHVEIDGFDVTGIQSVPYTGLWDSDSWITIPVSGVSLSAGQHVMRVFVDDNYFDLNYIEILIPSACSQADSNSNSIIEIGELLTYIADWKTGTVVIGDLLTAIGEWKNGC